MKSQREDGRGHWPRGRRRSNAPRHEVRDVVGQVRRLLVGRPHSEYTAMRVAEYIGVHDRTVRRWIAGEDWPDRRTLAKLRRLIRRWT